MRHQELHLIGQDAAVAQNEIFPQAGNIRRVKQWHVGLFGRATALAVIAGAAGGDHVHPCVDAVLSEWNDVLARQIRLVEMPSAVGTDIAVTHKQFAVGQARTQIERIDVGYSARTNNAVHADDGLQPRAGVVSAMKYGHFTTRLPAHLVRGIVNHRLLQRDP